VKGSLQGYSLCTIKTNIIRHAIKTDVWWDDVAMVGVWCG